MGAVISLNCGLKFSKVRGHAQQAQYSLAVGRGRHVLDGVDFPLVGADAAWGQLMATEES